MNVLEKRILSYPTPSISERRSSILTGSPYVQGNYLTAFKNERMHGELYLGYLNYKSFQGATDITIGRFAHLTNKILSLDGVSVSRITPWHFGISGFIGAPNHFDADDYRDAFRHTGDAISPTVGRSF
jgi:hypothetical protein